MFISGMNMLWISSFVTVASIYAGGIGLSVVMQRCKDVVYFDSLVLNEVYTLGTL